MKKFVLIIAFLIGVQTYSQKAEDEFALWYTYAGSHKIKGNFSLKSLAWFQFYDFGSEIKQSIFRLGGNYKITPNFNATLGYCFVTGDKSFKKNGGGFNEHRIYEDFNYKHKIGTSKFAHRIRFEHQFRENIDTKHRVRYKLQVSHKIYKKLSAYVYDEIFFNLKKGKKFGLNWATVGLKYKIYKGVNLQLGYIKALNSKGKDFDIMQAGFTLSH